MSRTFHPHYMFRSAALLGVILLFASFISYGIIYVMINAQSSYTGQSVADRIQLMVWFAMTLYWIIGSFFIIIVGLFVTHKVAGPLYRVELTLDEAESGALPDGVHLRDGDQLQSLADAQAVIFTYLTHREQGIVEHWERVEKLLDSLVQSVESATPDEWSRLVADLQSECSALAAEAARQARDDELPPEPPSAVQKSQRKGERGITLLELTIVLAIISILAAITFPLLAGLKDRATWGTAKRNLTTIRSALAMYAANDISNKYPASVTWNDLSSPTGFMGDSNFPDTMEAAKFTAMLYSTTVNRSNYTIVATVGNKFSDTIRATPSVIFPDSYPH